MPIEEAVERGFLPEDIALSDARPGLFACSVEFLQDWANYWKLIDTVKTEPITQDEISEWREEYTKLEKTDFAQRRRLLESLGFEIVRESRF
jgi:DNA mismatch repair ATPase MutL